MTTIAFDTLNFVEKLKAAGISEALYSQLATKNDLIKLDRRLDGLDAKIDRMDTKLSAELTLLKWMLGFLMASVIKTFFS